MFQYGDRVSKNEFGASIRPSQTSPEAESGVLARMSHENSAHLLTPLLFDGSVSMKNHPRSPAIAR